MIRLDHRGRKKMDLSDRRKKSHFKAAFTRLTNLGDWIAFAQSRKRPAGIPSSPHTAYSGTGWQNYGDWLGTGNVHSKNRKFQSFKQARAFARKLRLKTATEWLTYAKSRKRPDDIPFCPRVAYAGKGWQGWDDWLGTGRKRRATI
jgi:hypothetical protein